MKATAGQNMKFEKNNNQDLAAAMPPGQFRMILSYKQQATSGKRLKLQAASCKQQA